MFDNVRASLRPCLTPESSDWPCPVVMPAVNPEHTALVVLLRNVASGSGQRWSDVTARILDLESAEHALAELGHPQTAAARKAADRDLEKAVAVVGSRKASDESLCLAAGIATLLVKDEISVLSGLADGVDAAAHPGALARAGHERRPEWSQVFVSRTSRVNKSTSRLFRGCSACCCDADS